MLKEKKKQLEQQLRSASRDKASFGHSPMPFDNKEENKIRELEKKLAQVERELGQKDNDTYRRQHSTFTDQ